MDHITGHQDEELLAEIKDLLYPKYPPGCDDATFIAQFDPLFQYIKRFDTAPSDDDTSATENIILQIIPLINTCLTHCPRKQLITKLLSVIANCKGLLKNLAVGRQAIRMSKWQTELGLQNPITKIYAVTDPSLRMATDALYLKHRKIPNLELLLANYGELLTAKERFEQAITSQASRVPLDHHCYLAIIAAATFGSKYMFSRAVEAFSSNGGDMKWITEGTSAAPAILQEMARFSGLLAYNPSGILLTSPFRSKTGFANTDREYKLEALIILSYYQCLSCLSLAAGLIPECDNYEQYLPKASLEGTSYKSFETLRHCQNLLAQEEQKTAEELGKLFAWQSEQEQLINKIKSAVSIAAKKTASCELLRKIQSAKSIEEEELHEKLQSLRCLEQLKRSFSQFVDFQPLVQAFKVPKIPTEDDIVLASEWEFEMQGLKRLESVMGSKTRGALAKLVQSFKVFEDQSKQITHYYQFYNGYIHEFLTYTKLLQSISTAERGYIKLITKSSFLFSRQTFLHMKSQLSQKSINALEFAFEAIGCKLQLTVTFITLLLDRDYEETNE